MGFVSTDDVDPTLEMSVDESRPRVTIRLFGVLDRTTRRAFVSVVDNLISGGFSSFSMDMRQAEIPDASGATALPFCHRLIREAGGTIVWGGVHLLSGASHIALGPEGVT